MAEAGLPTDAWQVVAGRGSVVGTALIDAVDYICFTGSTSTGRTVGEQAGRRLIGASLELGGKNPLIVRHDADLQKAAEGCVGGRLRQHRPDVHPHRARARRPVRLRRVPLRPRRRDPGPQRRPDLRLHRRRRLAGQRGPARHRRPPRRAGPGRRRLGADRRTRPSRPRTARLRADRARGRHRRDGRLRRGDLRARSSRSTPPPRTTRPSRWPTGAATASRPASGAATYARPAGSPAGSEPARSTSTTAPPPPPARSRRRWAAWATAAWAGVTERRASGATPRRRPSPSSVCCPLGRRRRSGGEVRRLHQRPAAPAAEASRAVNTCSPPERAKVDETRRPSGRRVSR